MDQLINNKLEKDNLYKKNLKKEDKMTAISTDKQPPIVNQVVSKSRNTQQNVGVKPNSSETNEMSNQQNNGFYGMHNMTANTNQDEQTS